MFDVTQTKKCPYVEIFLRTSVPWNCFITVNQLFDYESKPKTIGDYLRIIPMEMNFLVSRLSMIAATMLQTAVGSQQKAFKCFSPNRDSRTCYFVHRCATCQVQWMAVLDYTELEPEHVHLPYTWSQSALLYTENTVKRDKNSERMRDRCRASLRL